jgi:hypothetical protein
MFNISGHKSKQQCDFILPQSEWLSSRIQIMTNAGEDVEKETNTVGRNVN